MARDWRSRLRAVFGRVVLGLGLAVLIQFLGIRSAQADFTAPYGLSNITVVNSTFSNGSMQSPDNGKSIVLTGPNDGSGLSGHTDATLICRGSGIIKFKYSYASVDDPGYDTAGYLLKGQYTALANADKSSGQVSVSVTAGDVFGFRVESTDNTGEAGILTISDISFPPSVSVTTLSSDPNPSVFGQTVTLAANVTSAVGQPGGSIVFKDGNVTLASQTLNAAGRATLILSGLSVGDHVVSASYAGDGSFAASASTAFTQTVKPGPTLTSMSSSSKPSVFGQAVTLTATVTSAAPATGVPSGTVTFAEGNTQLGTVVLNGSGVATQALPSLTVGAHTFTATYATDSRYAGSVTTLIQTVNPAGTATALTSSSDAITKSQSVTFTATVSAVAPGAGTMTGTVTFKDGAATLGTASLSANLRATLTTSTLSTGTRTITAVYNGDANFNASTSPAMSELVNKAPTTTTLSPLGPPVSVGGCIGLSASVTSAAGAPTGSVTFRAGSYNIIVPLNASGIASAPNVCLNLGSYVITAEYTGDINFLASSSAGAPFHVELISTSITAPVLRSGNPLPGEDLVLEARVTSEGRMTGSVGFFDGYTSLGSSPVDSQGTAVLTGHFTVGLHLVTAYYEGDVSHAPARSEPLFLTIRGATVVELSSTPNPSGPGMEVVFTAKVSGPAQLSDTPTGSVTFTDGGGSLGTAVLSSGFASIKSTTLGPGDHTIVAAYAGDTNYAGSTSKPFSQRVVRATSTTALDGQIDGAGYLLAAKVGCSGTPATGAVQFEEAGTNALLGSATLANGAASLRLAAPIPVGQQIRASYGGDSRCDTSRSEVLPIIALTNAFSFEFAGFAVNEIVSIFGKNLSATSGSAPSVPLPRTIGGVTVDIVDADGHTYGADLYFVSASQINFVVPPSVPPGWARAVIRSAGGTTAVSFLVSKVSPALASLNGTGSGTAAGYFIRVHADGSQDPAVVASGVPMAFGEADDRLFVILYGTGLRNASGPPECHLNGAPAPVSYAGPHSAYPGLDQINLEVPATLRDAGAVSATCTVEGMNTNGVSINLK
jgi:uncharacterized protein (TIGR03437 family)